MLHNEVLVGGFRRQRGGGGNPTALPSSPWGLAAKVELGSREQGIMSSNGTADIQTHGSLFLVAQLPVCTEVVGWRDLAVLAEVVSMATSS